MTGGAQRGDQLAIVVDLAVVGDDDAAVLVEQRLLAAREIDDRQPAMAEPDSGRAVETGTVGTAMVERVVHPLEERTIDRSPAARIEDADQPAHLTLRR